jgi:branched-chain amino acid transport system substrate-binding protein
VLRTTVGTRGRLRWAGVAVAGAVVLGACSPGVRGTATSTTTPQAGPTATVRIGFLGDLTGTGGQLGRDIESGEKLAISQFDAVDPPVKVALDPVDTAGDANRAKAGAVRLAVDRVVAVVGPTYGAEAIKADPVFEQAGIPDITASATDAQLADHRWRFFHRVVADNALQGQADGAYLVRGIHASTVGLVDDSSPSARDLTGPAAGAIAAAGGTVVSDDHLDVKAATAPGVVDRIVASAPDAVFFAGDFGAAGHLLGQLKAKGYTGKFMAAGGSDPARLVAAGATSAEGAFVSCVCSATADNPDAQAFNAAYLAQFGSSPGPYSAEAYDATNAVLEAIRSGRTAPSAINAYLATVDYHGITRSIRFQADGDWAGDTVYVYKVAGGQLTQIATAG